MNELNLKEYKNIYTDITVPHAIVDAKWKLHRELLPVQDSQQPLFYRFMPYGTVFASILFFIITTITFAQNAQPGSPLYPVKALTKNVSAKFTNTFQTDLRSTDTNKIHKANTIIATPTISVSEVTSTPQPTKEPESESSDSKFKNTIQIHTTGQIEEKGSTAVTNVPAENSVHGTSDNTNTSNNGKSGDANGNVKGASTENSHAGNNAQTGNANNNGDNNNSSNEFHGNSKK
ncbi:MAG TPA: hypothetical protein VND99_05780 [Candidatus Acidoferrales bacterium]|nr:hypothetical protein [Candidatus Acidoferrales bacterium]